MQKKRPPFKQKKKINIEAFLSISYFLFTKETHVLWRHAVLFTNCPTAPSPLPLVLRDPSAAVASLSVPHPPILSAPTPTPPCAKQSVFE